MTTVEELIEDATGLLLDFDGPVTALMPPPLNAQAADRTRAALSGVELPDAIRRTTDHLAVLRWTAENSIGRLVNVENACTEVEVECAGTSEPSPEIEWLLDRATRRTIPVAIVSNNSEEAVRVFVDRLSWTDRFDAYACRTPATSRLLKPHPFLVTAATQLLDLDPRSCVFIGDSVSDIRAGRSAGVTVVALAKSPSRASDLQDAKPDAIMVRESA